MNKIAMLTASRQVQLSAARRPARWMQKAAKRIERRGTEGDFARKAKRAGMSTLAYANKVLADPNAPAALKKQANFAKNAIKVSRKRKRR